MEHNHKLKITPKYLVKYNKEIKEEISLMLQAKVDVPTAKRLLETKYSIKLRYNDVYYMMKVKNNETPILQLNQINESNCFKEIAQQLNLSNNECIYNCIYLMVCTQQMKDLYRYGDIILIDVTYNTNKLKLPLLIVSGINSENKSITLSYAFIKAETEE